MTRIKNLQAAEVVDDCFCLQSRMTARAITRQYNAVLAPLGLEVTEFSLLATLATTSGDSIAELADRLAFERTTLVRNLKRLEARGLITPSGQGGRAVWYVLTVEGRSLLRRAVPHWREAQAWVRRALGAGRSGAVLDALEALRAAQLPQR